MPNLRPVIRFGKPLLFDDTFHPDRGAPKLFDKDENPGGPPEECCCPEGCEFCPCCIRCPSISSDIDMWISGQAQDLDFVGVCDCNAFTSSQILGLAFDACSETSSFPLACDQSVSFSIFSLGGSCKMRAVLSGNSVHSGSPPGGLWTATWEKALGAGPIECSGLHVLPFVSSTGGDDVPCIFAGSNFNVDILIP